MKKLGVNAYDSTGKFKGVTNVLTELNNKTKDLTEEQRNNYFTMIGGATQIDTLNALMSGLNTTTADGVSELASLQSELENSTGALDSMAEAVNNTMTGAFARLNSAADDFKINMVKQLEPIITPTINKIANGIPKITEALTETANNAKNFGSAFINGFKNIDTHGIISAFLPAINEAEKFLPKIFGEKIGKAMSQSLASLVLKIDAENLMPKLDLIFASAKYFVTNFGAGVKKFLSGETFAEAFSESVLGLSGFINQLLGNDIGAGTEVFDKITFYVQKFSDAIEIAKNVLGKIGEVILNIAGFIIKNWSLIGPVLIGMTSSFLLVKGAISTWGKVVKTATTTVKTLGGAFSFLTSPIGIAILVIGAIIAIGILLYKNWDKIKAYAGELGEKIKKTFSDIKEKVTQTLTNLVENTKEKFNNIKESISTTITNLPETVSNIFNNIKEKVINAINSLAERFPFAFGLISAYFGSWIDSISVVIENVKLIFSNIIDFVKNVFTGNWQGAWENIKNIFKGAFGALGALAKAPLNAVIALINTAINGLNSLSISIPDWVPLLGGKSFDINIPQIPMLAKGSNYSPDTFIAGEAGPELITSRRGSKVFNALQTNDIFDNLLSGEDESYSDISTTTSNLMQSPSITINYSPQITLQGNDNDIKFLVEDALRQNAQDLKVLIIDVINSVNERNMRISNA